MPTIVPKNSPCSPLIGTAIGTIFGLLLSWLLYEYEFISLPGDVYFVDRLPVDVQPLDVLTIVGASLLISFLATLYPARRAAEYTPVEAIRHE